MKCGHINLGYTHRNTLSTSLACWARVSRWPLKLNSFIVNVKYQSRCKLFQHHSPQKNWATLTGGPICPTGPGVPAVPGKPYKKRLQWSLLFTHETWDNKMRSSSSYFSPLRKALNLPVHLFLQDILANRLSRDGPENSHWEQRIILGVQRCQGKLTRKQINWEQKNPFCYRWSWRSKKSWRTLWAHGTSFTLRSGWSKRTDFSFRPGHSLHAGFSSFSSWTLLENILVF